MSRAIRTTADAVLQHEDKVKCCINFNARRFLTRQIETSGCLPRWELPDQEGYPPAFASMTDTERSNGVHSILLVIIGPSEDINDLHGHVRHERKRARFDAKQSKYGEATYSMKGQCVCLEAFSGLVQFHPRTINEIARETASSSTTHLLDDDSESNRKGVRSVKTLIAITFLQRYGELNGMPCPTGPGLVRYSLPTVLHNTQNSARRVHRKMGRNSRQDENGVRTGISDSICDEFLFFRSFNRHLQISHFRRCESNFCDTCTTIGNSMMATMGSKTLNLLAVMCLQHRKKAKVWYLLYKNMIQSIGASLLEKHMHCTFSFAEKALLPSLLKQTGQFYFVMAVKQDIFCVQSINRRKTDVYTLLEGHLRTRKRQITLHLCSRISRSPLIWNPICNFSTCHASVRQLRGSEKEPFLLSLLEWRLIFVCSDKTSFYFPVAVHTKKWCDAAFRFIKKNLNIMNVLCLWNMMAAIDGIYFSTDIISCGLEALIPCFHVY